MPLDEKKEIENIILDTFPDQQEATFVEYTQLMINAGNEREEAGFRFKSLLKQTKFILQYCLVDGKQYTL